MQDFTFPLRQLGDARAIRTRLIEVFERASSDYCEPAERQRLLTFVIVGAGPTSVEFAAELYDFLQQDVVRLFPELAKLARVVMVEAGSRVLGSFSNNLSDYVKKLYEARHITLILNKSVKRVHQHHLELSDGEEIRFGLCVWVSLCLISLVLFFSFAFLFRVPVTKCCPLFSSCRLPRRRASLGGSSSTIICECSAPTAFTLLVTVRPNSMPQRFDLSQKFFFFSHHFYSRERRKLLRNKANGCHSISARERHSHFAIITELEGCLFVCC